MATLRRLMGLACLGTLLALAPACERRVESAAAQGPRPVIGVSVMTLTNPYFVRMSDALRATGEALGYRVVVVSGELDPDLQSAQVERFVRDGVDAIVICPVDAQAIGAAVARANHANIPVFTADTALLATGASIVAHVATDNEQGGRLAAEAICAAIGAEGKIAIIDHPGVESVLLRVKGFQSRLSELRKSGEARVELVGSEPGWGSRERSIEATESLLRNHPDIDAIFAINDPSALGVITALERAGKLADVAVVGFDGQPEAYEALESGRMAADIIQLPDQIGSDVIHAVNDHRLGRTVNAVQLIPTAIITAEPPHPGSQGEALPGREEGSLP